MKNIKMHDVAKAILLMRKKHDFQMIGKTKKITFLSGILMKEEGGKFYIFDDKKHTWILFSERGF